MFIDFNLALGLYELNKTISDNALGVNRNIYL